MSTSDASSSVPAVLDDLNWLSGGWRGTIGSRTVDENWSVPGDGSMEARVRIGGVHGVSTLEFIVIRPAADGNDQTTLVLHLRQFDPAMELRTNQSLRLSALGERSATFIAEPGSTIGQIRYTRVSQDRLQVDVTRANGDVLTADLRRS